MENTVKNLLFDSACGKEIYDESTDRVVSKAEVNEAIAKICFEATGLTKNSSTKQIKRALKSDKAVELFEVIEEAIEKKVATGLKESEFFNQFVDVKNIGEGDRNDFWVEDNDIILNVAKVSGGNHDLLMQKLGAGQSYSVPMSTYGIKVGSDIKLFLTGRKDWTDFVDAVARAYVKEIQDELYSEFMNAATQLPVPEPFIGNGELGAGTKDAFDEIIENVEMSNDGAPVVIMGTKTALKKLNGLTDVDWRADSQKEAVAATGILGSYETNTLLEIPQRFKNNDVTRKLIDNTKIYIMPAVDDNKFVKYVEGGEVELEVTEVGETMNDQQSYELQREIGIGTVITRNFGVWTLD